MAARCRSASRRRSGARSNGSTGSARSSSRASATRWSSRPHRPKAIAAALQRLRGIGPELASLLWLEALFRRFDTRRQIAAYAGLAPSPWQSGGIDREQGISKAGNRRLRHALIELAWFWLRHQPGSELSTWFRTRVGQRRGRIRRIAIVALARKLLVALWRYATQGIVPAGAEFKA